MTVHSQFKNPNRMDINDQPIAQRLIGKHVIVRSRNEGINFGKLEAADETGCVITDARRIWYHKPADSKMAWYEGVALSGLHRSSKVSAPVARKVIVEDYSLTECSDEAVASIQKHPNYEG